MERAIIEEAQVTPTTEQFLTEQELAAERALGAPVVRREQQAASGAFATRGLRRTPSAALAVTGPERIEESRLQAFRRQARAQARAEALRRRQAAFGVFERQRERRLLPFGFQPRTQIPEDVSAATFGQALQLGLGGLGTFAEQERADEEREFLRGLYSQFGGGAFAPGK